MNAVELSLFAHRLDAICEEMGAVLRRTALSPNIKDREDYSCAMFDAAGELVAQAAHIPVHLGSMAFCMRDVVDRMDWREGDVVMFNDPFLGGTHLPDLTLVAPLFIGDALLGFAASRAHHADVGGTTAGSMGIHDRLSDEGVVISPVHWWRKGIEDDAALSAFMGRVRSADERLADLAAQRAACHIGARRLMELNTFIPCAKGFAELLAASEAYGRKAVASIPDGEYSFEDALEDDGMGSARLPIQVRLEVAGERVHVDFTGTAAQCPGPVNCPLSVTAASVFYVFRCLMPTHTPQTSAIFRCIELSAPVGCIVNARPDTAVAAGNVETSQRIADVVLGALAQAIPERIPAAAQGTMNNVIFAGDAQGDGWVYYETLGGGMGAHANGHGLSAVQCHMTNTRNTSIEVLEMHYPLRITGYAVRPGSGGAGRQRGGDGLVREWQAVESCQVSLLAERRQSAPWGLNGGADGQPGRHSLIRDGIERELPAKATLQLEAGDRLRIETPGGGGFGKDDA